MAALLGMDLRDAVADLCSERPRGSPWWLLALAGELPDSGALAGSLRGGAEQRGWGLDRHLAADMWDLKAIELHGGSKHGKPPRYPRPGSKPAGKPLTALMPPRRKGPADGR